MLTRMINVAKAVLNPKTSGVVLKKIAKRLTDHEDKTTAQKNTEWIKANCRDFAAMATAIDPTLWQDALASSERLKARADKTFAELGIKMGGGGFYPMLYFLARQRKPDTIVETGVAAGFSSQVFLEALESNDRGHLYSSDFPYFRMDNAEKLIGVLVEEKLKSRWTLLIKGDEENLPAILKQVQTIDLFHYDSDKSASGRAFALAQVMPKMAKGGLIVMDDIQDNAHFMNTVIESGITSFSVFEFEGKYIGMYEV